jgi:pimeloyl-ACP methyl ester carboxylesterase
MEICDPWRAGNGEAATMNDSGAWEHTRIAVGGIELHCVRAGTGPLVLLLHGFPECWYSWRHQLGALSPSHRVVAPDLRGYNLSDKPRGLDAYRIDVLVEDVRALIVAHGAGRVAALVGHDWGGIVAWAFAMTHPDLLDRLVVMNAPHPSAYARFVRSHPRQLLRSWYMLLFQLPGLPERLFAARNYRAIERAFVGGAVRPGAFSGEDIAAFKRAAAMPGALTGAINYYRAALRRRDPRGLLPAVRLPWSRRPALRLPVVRTPTLVVWGDDDFVLDRGLTEHLDDFVAAPLEVVHIPRCGHWVQQEAPAEVNARLAAFLSTSW